MVYPIHLSIFTLSITVCMSEMDALWIFMLVAVLLTPLIMIGFGRLFMTNPPKEINSVFEYRTKRSMRNRDTWIFAHHYVGKLWFMCGFISAPLSLVPMLCVVGENADVVNLTGLILVCIQAVLLIATMVLTERALKKHFDDSGKPR